MSSKSNAAAIRRRAGTSVASNISAPSNTPNTNPSTDRVFIGDLIVSHNQTLAELRRTVSLQTEQIAELVTQVQSLTDGASVQLEVKEENVEEENVDGA